ncbi:MAG: hypothetical protein ACTSW1_13385 [Candidatus Hodarchaeales archaeon]
MKNKENLIILKHDQFIISKVDSKELLIPKIQYFCVDKIFWQNMVKFFSSSTQELRSPNKFFDLREILFNSELQRLARKRNENGDSVLFDLYIEFLKIASKPSKGEERYSKMNYLGLKILNKYLFTSSKRDLEDVKKEALSIRNAPPELRRVKRGCILF